MNIGTLAKETGLAQSRIRYYEAFGLLGPVERKANGYRIYTRETKQVLQIITTAQEAGFSLDEIRNFMPRRGQAGWNLVALVGSLRAKMADIEVRQTQLARTHSELGALAARIESGQHDGNCFDNAQAALAGVGTSGRPAG